MPQVETYGAPRVRQRPLAGVQRTPAAAGVNVGEAMGGFGATVAGATGRMALTMAAAERERADQTAVLEASNKLASTENAMLYDPNSGALTVKGKDAAGLVDTVPAQMDQAVGEISAALTNDRQRAEFGRYVAQRRLAVDYSVRRHVYEQMRAFDVEETKAFIDNTTNNAVVNAGKPELVALAAHNATEKAADFARRNGYGPEQTQQLLQETSSKLWVGVIDSLLANDQDQAAQAYYDELRGGNTPDYPAIKSPLTSEAIQHIEKALEDGKLRGQGQRETDRIMQEHNTLDEALKDVRTITDPKLRDEVQGRVEHQFLIKDKLQRDTDEANMTRLYNVVEKQGLNAVRKDPTWQTLSGSERAGLRSYANSLVEGTAVKTDQAKWYSLFTLATNPATQDQFAQTNLLQFKSVLSNGDFQQLAEIQARIRQGDQKGASVLAATESETKDITDSALRSIGLDPTPPDKGSKGYSQVTTDKVDNFRRAVRTAVAAQEAEAGGKRKLTTQEIQQTVDDLMIRTQKQENHWFAPDVAEKFAFEPQAFVSKVSDVPQGEQAAIRAALAKKGITPTDQRVLALFNAKLARLRGEKFFPLE